MDGPIRKTKLYTGIKFAYSSIRFWNCSDNMVFFHLFYFLFYLPPQVLSDFGYPDEALWHFQNDVN
jgi:hypothetical protein